MGERQIQQYRATTNPLKLSGNCMYHLLLRIYVSGRKNCHSIQQTRGRKANLQNLNTDKGNVKKVCDECHIVKAKHVHCSVFLVRYRMNSLIPGTYAPPYVPTELSLSPTDGANGRWVLYE